MQLNVRFVIKANHMLAITVPETDEKENYYYTPQHYLHRFDVAILSYIAHGVESEILEDNVEEVLTSLSDVLYTVLHKPYNLPQNISPGNAGKTLNWIYDEDYLDHPLKKYVVGFTLRNPITTIIYKQNDIPYIEVIPLYPWHYIEPQNKEMTISFREYMKQYKPYVFTQIEWNTLYTWYEDLRNILTLIHTNTNNKQ